MNVNFKVIFMKKQLLFCSLALASSLTAMAEVGDPVKDLSQLSNDKCYTIAPAGAVRGTWTYSTKYPDYLVSTLKTSEEVSTANSNQQFAFLKSSSGKYYIYSVGGGKFLYYANNNLVGLSASVTSVAYEANVIQSEHANVANFPWVAALNGGTQQMNLCSPNGVADGQPGVVFYNIASDDGNAISITEAGEFDSDAALEIINRYETNNTPENQALVEEAAAYLNVPKNAVGGYDLTLWQALYDACGGDGADVTDVDDEFKAALTALKNSKPRATAFSNDKLYQIVCVDQTRGYLCSVDEESGVSRIFTSVKAGENMLAGSDKWQVFTEDGVTYLYNQGVKGYVNFAGGAMGGTENVNNWWTLDAVPATINIQANEAMGGVAAYWIQDPDYTGGQHVHANNSYPTGVPAWYADGVASHFYFVEVDGTPDELSPALNAAKADAQVFLDAYDAAKANYVGAYSAESIQALDVAVNAADATAESVNAAIETAKASAKKVEAGKYYMIQNANTFDDGNLKSIYENPDGQNIAWNTVTQSAAELWQLVPADNGEYLIKSANTGKYIRYERDGVCAKMGEADDRPFTLAPGTDNYTFGLWCYGTDRSDYSDMVPNTADGFGVIGGTNVLKGGYVSTYKGNRFAAWNLVEVSSVKLTVGETGYATAYFPFAVTIPAGVTAYTVAAAADGVATLKKLSGTIPAHTGVVLSGTANTPCTFEFAADVAAVDGNMLDGMTIATEVSAETKAYILANGSEGVGFYRLSESDRTIAANKAYLIVDDAAEPSAVFSLKLDGGLTGINGVEVSAGADAPVYDLQGRRLPQVPTKGLYIQNGKKIMK